MGETQNSVEYWRSAAESAVAAIRAIDRAAVPVAEDDDGFVTRYEMPVGPLHRALGMIVGAPYNPDAIEAAEWRELAIKLAVTTGDERCKLIERILAKP